MSINIMDLVHLPASIILQSLDQHPKKTGPELFWDFVSRFWIFV